MGPPRRQSDKDNGSKRSHGTDVQSTRHDNQERCSKPHQQQRTDNPRSDPTPPDYDLRDTIRPAGNQSTSLSQPSDPSYALGGQSQKGISLPRPDVPASSETFSLFPRNRPTPLASSPATTRLGEESRTGTDPPRVLSESRRRENESYGSERQEYQQPRPERQGLQDRESRYYHEGREIKSSTTPAGRNRAQENPQPQPEQVPQGRESRYYHEGRDVVVISSTTSAGRNRAHQDPTVEGVDPPRSHQGGAPALSTSHLSKTGQAFLQIGPSSFEEFAVFIKNHPTIVQESSDNIKNEALRLKKEGRLQQTKCCLQLFLILRYHRQMDKTKFQEFFRGMISNDKKISKRFHEDFDQIFSAVREAASVQSASVSTETTTLRPREQPSLPVSNNEERRPYSGRHVSGPPPYNVSEREMSGTIRRRSVNESIPPNIPTYPSTRKDATEPRHPVRHPEPGRGRTIPVLIENDNPSSRHKPPSEIDIKGTPSEKEELDPRYKKRKDAKDFFTVGRVFSLLWHENAGENKLGDYLSEAVYNRTTQGRYGERIFSHIRRMAVVQQRQGYCVCVPINTYSGKGLTKPGLNSEEKARHAVIFDATCHPFHLASEADVTDKKPIAVNMADSEQKLDPMSRINFGKPYSIEWNVKVMNVGRIAEKSRAAFESYWQIERKS